MNKKLLYYTVHTILFSVIQFSRKHFFICVYKMFKRVITIGQQCIKDALGRSRLDSSWWKNSSHIDLLVCVTMKIEINKRVFYLKKFKKIKTISVFWTRASGQTTLVMNILFRCKRLCNIISVVRQKGV